MPSVLRIGFAHYNVRPSGWPVSLARSSAICDSGKSIATSRQLSSSRPRPRWPKPRRAIQSTTTRLSDLEVQRINQLPDLKTQLVDIYKRGRSGYARMLFSAGDLREFARATRAVSALSAINERRIEEHRKTVEAMRQERAAFEQKAKELQAKTAEARRAKSAADGAVASASELIRQIDSRRDMTAQYVGELQDAYGKLQQQVTALSTEKPAGAEPVAVPLRPFQGALDWPVQGRIIGFFGQPSNRLGGSAVRNGIEIAADEDTPVRAIHGGSVGFAGPFTGFGTLVILDHGGNGYSLYGYLASTALEQGQHRRNWCRGGQGWPRTRRASYPVL